MQNISRWKVIRLSIFALIALTMGQTLAYADVMSPPVVLPPSNGAYSLPLVCIAPVCLNHILVSGFHVTDDLFAGGNEFVSVNAVFSADIFQNHAGSPGAFLGPLLIPGTMDFTFFGRALSSATGTFDSQITDFDFSGMFNGHTFEVMQNPNRPSLGITTITALDGGRYQVSSFFDVFAQLSLDGGPFVPGPVRHAVFITPEPGSAGALLIGLIGLAGLAGFRVNGRSDGGPQD